METLLKIVLGALGSFGIIGLLIVFILFFPEKVKLIQASITQLFGDFSFWARKSTIKNRIEGSCDAALKDFHKELPDVSIPNLVVEWVDGSNFETRVKDDEAVVLLRYSKNDTLNIVTATTAYVKDAFLINAKPYLSEAFRKGLDLSVIRYVLNRVKNNNKSVVSRFIEENSVAIKESSAIINKIENINDAGLFTRLMIRELDGYGNNLLGRVPSKEHADEADEFLDFLYKIATREPDEYTRLAFVRPDIRVGVLLVAKLDNYVDNGLKPYLNRIKKGFALGVNTFYLLAREERIDILDEVFKDLFLTGNFTLLKNPKVFNDRQGREVKCYCIMVDKEGAIDKAYEEVNRAMSNSEELEAIITHIREDRITIDYNGLKGYVYKQNFSNKEIASPFEYFLVGSVVYAKPIEISGEGDVEFSIAGTKSDPISVFSTYKIGMQIDAEVTYADDTFVKFRIPESTTTGIAFRENLTYSRFLLLHRKFVVGSTFSMKIKELEPECNNLILQLYDLTDPWQFVSAKKGDAVKIEICRKDTNALVGELEEGITAVLTNQELSWDETQSTSLRKNVRLGSMVDCFVDRVDRKQKVVYVTMRKSEENPYLTFYEGNKGKDVKVVIDSINEFGVCGKIGKLNLFVPISETYRGKAKFPYKEGKTVLVRVKDISVRKDSIIGSFLPFIPYALESFKERFSEGYIFDDLKPVKNEKQFITFKKKYQNKVYYMTLFISDIASEGYVEDLPSLYNHVSVLPLAIKKIDLDSDRVYLSLKDATSAKEESICQYKYGQEYDGIVLSHNREGYRILLLKTFIEVQLCSTKRYNTGDKVSVVPERLSAPITFMD